MMYHFFNIGTYSPRSTKVLLGYVVMYVEIYIWAKWDLGTLGGKHSFLQIYTAFVPNWLNISNGWQLAKMKKSIPDMSLP